MKKGNKLNKEFKVDHDLNEINTEEQYIMTIKDKGILDNQNDAEEARDILEIQELKDKRNRDAKVRKQKVYLITLFFNLL